MARTTKDSQATTATSETSGPTDDSSIGFTAAMEELASIVDQLESNDIDVDLMAQQVERAALLVEVCRGRLDATRYRVEEIIVRLDPDATGEDAADTGDGDKLGNHDPERRPTDPSDDGDLD